MPVEINQPQTSELIVDNFDKQYRQGGVRKHSVKSRVICKSLLKFKLNQRAPMHTCNK